MKIMNGTLCYENAFQNFFLNKMAGTLIHMKVTYLIELGKSSVIILNATAQTYVKC